MRVVENKIPNAIFFRIAGFVGLILLLTLTSRSSSQSTLIASTTFSKTNQTDLSQKLQNANNYISLLPEAKKPAIYARQYALLDGNTGEIIIANLPDVAIPIASTTKMTTALVAISILPLDRIVTISSKPPLISGSKIGLRSGEKITIKNLLRGLLIYSGNDAAFALAEAYADKPGDYQQFVDAMNEFAQSNHLVNTIYGDPAGLDDETGRSTPRVLANVARLLLQNSLLAEIVSTPETTIASSDGQITHRLTNTNRLIQIESPYYLPRAMGVKTGFTLDAGHSLVAGYKWQDRVLIGVIMNTTESTNTASAKEMNKLFRWADNSLTLKNY